MNISKPANNYKFNAGTELNDYFDVDYYETYFRNYDAQVGRFTRVDVLAENYFSQSLYHFSYNDPISFNDPLGAYPYDPDNQHTGLIFINGEYHFERSYWNYDPYSAIGFGNPESPGGGGPRSFENSKYGYDKYGNYGIWLRYSRLGTYSSETGLPEVVVGTKFVGLGEYYKSFNDHSSFNNFPPFATLWKNYPHDNMENISILVIIVNI